MWPRPATPSEVKTGWRIKLDSMCRRPAGTAAPARDFGSGRVRLAAALAQQQLEVLAQRQFHVGLGLREAIRPDADSHFFGAAVPALVIQPELAFDTEAGSHPERDSMVRHLLPPKEDAGGIMPQLMATRVAAKKGVRVMLNPVLACLATKRDSAASTIILPAFDRTRIPDCLSAAG